MRAGQPPDLLIRSAMKVGTLIVVLVAAGLLAFAGGNLLLTKPELASASAGTDALSFAEARDNFNLGSAETAAPASYRLDASRSKFIAKALRGGLLWFKGKDHLIAVRDFTGEAVLDPDVLANSSLRITAKAASMEETSSAFTDQQKQIINKELREIVLHPDQHPDIVFSSTAVTGKPAAAGQYDLEIIGNLTLHGVTRPVKIPTKVIVNGDELRAQGEFSISRDDFGVKATSAFHGLVRVRDKVKFEFDILGNRR